MVAVLTTSTLTANLLMTSNLMELKACIIGQPIAHSLSPLLHSYWLQKAGIKGRYDAIEIEKSEVKLFLEHLAERGYQGCNVTIPHKLAAYELCDDLSPAAHKIQAVNTIIVQSNGRLLGDNSDWSGFSNNLNSYSEFQTLPKHTAILLGAGGAARAIIYGLQKLGFKKIVVISRDPRKLYNWQEEFPIIVGDWSELDWYFSHANLLVNSTALGLNGEQLPIDFDQLPNDILLHDIVYRPLWTPFLLEGKKRGFKTIDGLGMLMHQAVLGFMAWFKPQQPPSINNELRQYLISQMKS